jgi:hypothetical protein
MTQDQIWNLADCATQRAVHYLLRGDQKRALAEIETGEMYQRMHSYTLADRPCYPTHAYS